MDDSPQRAAGSEPVCDDRGKTFIASS